MDAAQNGFDLKVSPKVVVYFLIAVGILIFALSNAPAGLPQKFAIVVFSAAVFLSTWVAWQIIKKNELIGSWVVIAIIILIIYASAFGLGINFALLFTAFPVILAAALINWTKS